jgi:nitroimidazol reductase NimA-like FMN-containing flavoprotein (pyridoxamine 5'-phosphate oxidase superfamily)
MLERMTALLRSKDLCVLATDSGNGPYCSLMAYLTDDEGKNVYLATYKTSQKYTNLRNRPRVSLLVDSRENRANENNPAQALTITGLFQPWTPDEQDEQEHIRNRFLQKHPDLEPILQDPDCEIVRIKPTSLLLLDGPTQATKLEL